MSYFWGSICLDDIPPEQIKQVTFASGVVKRFVNIKVKKMPEVKVRNNNKFEYMVTCEPKRDLQKPGVNYKIGELCEPESKPYSPDSGPVIVEPKENEIGGNKPKKEERENSSSSLDSLPF